MDSKKRFLQVAMVVKGNTPLPEPLVVVVGKMVVEAEVAEGEMVKELTNHTAQRLNYLLNEEMVYIFRDFEESQKFLKIYKNELLRQWPKAKKNLFYGEELNNFKKTLKICYENSTYWCDFNIVYNCKCKIFFRFVFQ